MLQNDPDAVENLAESHALYRYYVYGITIDSEIELALPKHGHGDLGQIEVRTAPAYHFHQVIRDLPLEQIDGSWYQFGRLQDRSSYVRWEGVGEFLISSAGHSITGRQFHEAHEESFQIYLLNQAISFALVKRGFEPLHATTVSVNGGAVVLLGESGYGKSSLAACFLDAGHRLLTDDLLILQPSLSGITAYPGPPRIKLYPKLARRFLANPANGTSMNSRTKKLILSLNGKGSTDPIPLKAIYTLTAPREVFRKQRVRISVLSPRESFLELVKNTFNYRIVNSDRMERQFRATSQLVDVMLVRKISYPRVLAELPAVRDAILADLNSESGQPGRCES
jgi:hypothetical protein